MKRQAVTGLAARARLAEDGAAHHLPIVDADAGHLLLLQFLSRRLRLQSLRLPRLNDFECNFFALVSPHCTAKDESIIRINLRIRRHDRNSGRTAGVRRSAWSPRSRI